MESRNARLFSLLDGKADVVAIVNSGDSHIDHNFKYFTNAKSGIFEGSIAFVGPKKTTVVTSQLEAASLKGLDVNVKVFGTRKQFEKIAAKILKKPEKASWGGYSGYFSGPDGYPWVIACNPHWEIDSR